MAYDPRYDSKEDEVGDPMGDPRGIYSFFSGLISPFTGSAPVPEPEPVPVATTSSSGSGAGTTRPMTPSLTTTKKRKASILPLSKDIKHEKYEDLYDYLPVFIYSHAGFPDGKACKFADPIIGNKVDIRNIEKGLTTEEEFFVKVPENTVVIDPIIPGTVCLTSGAIDNTFPTLISLNGLNTWFSESAFTYYNNIVELETPKGKKALKDFYDNTKLYYPGERVNNFELIFDIDIGIKKTRVPWVIRAPKLDNSGNITGELKDVLYEWTRQYSDRRGDRFCIYLNEFLKGIDERLRPMYPGKKIALIFVSCRRYPAVLNVSRKMSLIDYILRYNSIRKNGIQNTEMYRKLPNEGKASNINPFLGEDKPIIESIRKTFEEFKKVTPDEIKENIFNLYDLWSRGMIDEYTLKTELKSLKPESLKPESSKPKSLKRQKTSQFIPSFLSDGPFSLSIPGITSRLSEKKGGTRKHSKRHQPKKHTKKHNKKQTKKHNKKHTKKQTKNHNKKQTKKHNKKHT